MPPKKKQKQQVIELSEKEKRAVQLIDKTSLMEIIQLHQKRNLEQKHKIEEIKNQIEQTQQKQVIESLQLVNDSSENDLQEENLQKQIRIEIQELERFNNEEVIKMQNILKEKQNEYQKQKQEKLEEMKAKQDLIQYIEDFPKRDIQYKIEKEQYLAQLQEKKKTHNLEFEKAQQLQNKKLNQFQDNHQKTIKEIQQKSYIKAEESIGVKPSEFKLKYQNQKLDSQIQQNQEEIQKIQKEKGKFMIQNKNTNLIEGVQEHEYINHKLLTNLKDGEKQIEYLKTFIIKEMDKYDKQIQEIKQNGNQKIQFLQDKIKNLLSQISQKESEINKTSKILQMILDSRTDIEEYFLEAFYEMKQELKNSSIQEEQSADQSKSVSKISQRPLRMKQFNEQQKEQLLKLVFQKINNQQKSVNWRKSLVLQNHSQNFDQSTLQLSVDQ